MACPRFLDVRHARIDSSQPITQPYFSACAHLSDRSAQSSRASAHAACIQLSSPHQKQALLACFLLAFPKSTTTSLQPLLSITRQIYRLINISQKLDCLRAVHSAVQTSLLRSNQAVSGLGSAITTTTKSHHHRSRPRASSFLLTVRRASYSRSHTHIHTRT